MPRFGSKYKMFSHIIPSTELDITDLVYKGTDWTHWLELIKGFIFNKRWLQRCRIIVMNLSPHWQLLGNASSAAAWLSTNVCSAWPIADCSQGGSNSIVMCATHRWASRGPCSRVKTSHSAWFIILIFVKSEHSAHKNNKSVNSVQLRSYLASFPKTYNIGLAHSFHLVWTFF